jgi:hypothetical protein
MPFPAEHSWQPRLSVEELGKILAHASQVCGIPFDPGEYFFVKTGFSPYWHTCIDDFIPMLCPACEWSSRHRELIDWRSGALLKLERRLKNRQSKRVYVNPAWPRMIGS